MEGNDSVEWSDVEVEGELDADIKDLVVRGVNALYQIGDGESRIKCDRGGSASMFFGFNENAFQLTIDGIGRVWGHLLFFPDKVLTTLHMEHDDELQDLLEVSLITATFEEEIPREEVTSLGLESLLEDFRDEYIGYLERLDIAYKDLREAWEMNWSPVIFGSNWSYIKPWSDITANYPDICFECRDLECRTLGIKPIDEGRDLWEPQHIDADGFSSKWFDAKPLEEAVEDIKSRVYSSLKHDLEILENEG